MPEAYRPDEASLHDAGWRQGSMFSGELVVGCVDVESPMTSRADLWVVCTQDCDLDTAAIVDTTPPIELHAVFLATEAIDMGIRNRRLALDDSHYVDAVSPKLSVTPRFLAAQLGKRLPQMEDSRAVALKMWLGRRYDRPALPPHLVDLARAIAKECSRKPDRGLTERVHDVLMTFDESGSPYRYSLYAVIPSDADSTAIRAWLAAVTQRVDASLGVADRLEVATKDEVSIALLESSYAADLSQLTWRQDGSIRGA